MKAYESKIKFIQHQFPIARPFLSECHLKYYQTFIGFYSTSSQFIEAIKEYHPTNWLLSSDQDSYEFVFLDYKDFFSEYFFEEEDPEFNVFTHLGAKVCIQRDFIGWTFDDKKFYFITQLEINDGYFNCLRWAIPGLLVKKKSLILHSSCFATHENDAYMFLGASGAGKTTTVKGFSDQCILGDDMNVISLTPSSVGVHSGAIGGQIVHPHFDQQFHLKRMFWLNKGHQLSINKISQADARLKLLGSVANLFLGHESASFIDETMDLIDQIASRVPMFELNLMKGDSIWPFIKT